MTNCTFTACSYWWLSDTPVGDWDGLYTMSNCIASSSILLTFAGEVLSFAWSGGHASTNAKQVTNCSFDSIVMFDSPTWIAYTNCVFAGGITNGVGTPVWPSDAYFNNNVVVFPGTLSLYGSIRDCYCVVDGVLKRSLNRESASRPPGACSSN